MLVLLGYTVISKDEKLLSPPFSPLYRRVEAQTPSTQQCQRLPCSKCTPRHKIPIFQLEPRL